jgi:hypothetical protein
MFILVHCPFLGCEFEEISDHLNPDVSVFTLVHTDGQRQSSSQGDLQLHLEEAVEADEEF